jgi:3-oxoacyl-[acyl-carrier-protein] synthase-1
MVVSERFMPQGGAQYAMSNSFAFGGSNVSLVLAR